MCWENTGTPAYLSSCPYGVALRDRHTHTPTPIGRTGQRKQEDAGQGELLCLMHVSR
jgi:hypothetical protein